MDANKTPHIFVVEQRSPIRRVQSIGDGTYAMIRTMQTPLIAQSPTAFSTQPVLLQTLPQTHNAQGFQSHRFSPYQSNRRPRSNSDNSPTIMMMNAVVPATVIPSYAVVADNLSVGNTKLNAVSMPTASASSSTRQVLVTEAPLTPPCGVVSPAKRVLCLNCGVETETTDTSCRRCRRIIFPNPTCVQAGLRSRQTFAGQTSTSKASENGLPSSQFYTNGNTDSDFMRYLKQSRCNIVVRKVPRNSLQKRANLVRKKTVEKAEAVCITISSDSEDEDASPCKGSTPTASPQTPSPAAPLSQSSILSVDETPSKRLKQDVTFRATESPVAQASPIRMTFAFPEALSPSSSSGSPVSKPPPLTDDVLSRTTLNLKINSIRLGQMKLVPKTVCRLSHQNITMTAHCPDLNTDVILTVPWHGILNCDLCGDPQEPCIFLVLNPAFLPKLRETLRMEKGEHPYYDPEGQDDERYFIFYLNSPQMVSSADCNFDILCRKIGLIRKKMKRPTSFLQKISSAESASRQNAAACSEAAADTRPSVETEVPPASPLLQVAASPSPHPGPARPVTPEPCERHVLTRRQAKQTEESTASGDLDDLKMMFSGPRIQLFVYPPPPATGGIPVTNEDQFCLNKGEFLNDVIIDFYLKYISNQLLSSFDRSRTHIFSCFFYERLMQKPGKKNKDISASEQRHNQVKKWTRNVDIFSKDFIFVPINEASHWYLAVICFPSMAGTIAPVAPVITNRGKEKKPEQASQSSLPASMQYLTSYGDNDKEIAEDAGTLKGQDLKDLGVSEVKGEKDSNASNCEATREVEADQTSLIEVGKGSGVEGAKGADDTVKKTSDITDTETTCDKSGMVSLGEVKVIDQGVEFEEVKGQTGHHVKDESYSDVIVLDETETCLEPKNRKGTQNNLSKNNKRKLITITLPRFSKVRLGVRENLANTTPPIPLPLCGPEGTKTVTETPQNDLKSTVLADMNSEHVENNSASTEEDKNGCSRIMDPAKESPEVIVCDEPRTTLENSSSEPAEVSKECSENVYSMPVTGHPIAGGSIEQMEGVVQQTTIKTETSSQNVAQASGTTSQNEAQPVGHSISLCGAETDTYELSLVQDSPAFTLPTDLRDKCKISPSKRLEVRMERLPDEKSADFERCTCSLDHDRVHKDDLDTVAEHCHVTVLAKTVEPENLNSELCSNALDHDKKDKNCDDFEPCVSPVKSTDLIETSTLTLPTPVPGTEKTAHLEPCTSAVVHDESPGPQVAVAELPSTDETELSSNESSHFKHCTDPAGCDQTCNCCKTNSAKHGCNLVAVDLVHTDRDDKCAVGHNGANEAENVTSPTRSGDEAIILSSDMSDMDEKKSNNNPESISPKNDSEPTVTSIDANELETNVAGGYKNEMSSSSEKLGPAPNCSSENMKRRIFKRPCIIIFDSLRGPSRSKIATNLREYLCMEWITRKRATHGEKIFSKDTIKMSSAAVPQQDNYSDCGVFLLHYVEKFFSNPLTNFATPIRDLQNWFDPGECKHKRDEMKKIINDLHEDWIARNAE